MRIAAGVVAVLAVFHQPAGAFLPSGQNHRGVSPRIGAAFGKAGPSQVGLGVAQSEQHVTKASSDGQAEGKKARKPPFKNIMAANRAEIAVRIMRAATELNAGTVAIYCEEDRYAQHRWGADRSYKLEPKDELSTPISTYLDIPQVIQIAKDANVDAIHPGYGFLSESPEFAAACDEAGVTFVGPTVDNLNTFSDKTSARAAAIAAGVPVVPGSDGALETAEEVTAFVEDIGLPVILKVRPTCVVWLKSVSKDTDPHCHKDKSVVSDVFRSAIMDVILSSSCQCSHNRDHNHKPKHSVVLSYLYSYSNCTDASPVLDCFPHRTFGCLPVSMYVCLYACMSVLIQLCTGCHGRRRKRNACRTQDGRSRSTL